RDAIEAERDAAVRRRAVFERLEEEAEAELRFLLADVEQRENAALHRRVVDSDAATADFAAIEDEVVRLRPYMAGIGDERVDVLVVRRSERVMHRVVALRLRVPLQQGEVHDPGEHELVRLEQAVFLRKD